MHLDRGAFLPWAYSFDAFHGMTSLGFPGRCSLRHAVRARSSRPPRLLDASSRRGQPRSAGFVARRPAGTGALVFIGLILSIAHELGGLINVNRGRLGRAGRRGSGLRRNSISAPRPATDWWPRRITRLEILIDRRAHGRALFTAAYALNMDDGGIFVSFLAFLGTFGGLLRTGFVGYLPGFRQRHRQVLILAAFLVAFLFPFTQDGSDANMSIATQVLIFAATAMGLNIVVGLAGLLDLGYIAFLGAGAYGSRAVAFRVRHRRLHPPFIVVVLIGGAVPPPSA